tara:strand:+ start:1878 stop:3140 length:1263 start_codon:yes stop_codon:yes gene_type:complete
MASTFVNNLRLEEMTTGEQSGTWGTKTNTNLELVGEALGFGTEAITTNANTHATTVADATSDAGRAIYIIYTGTLDSACTITIGPDTLKRVHIIKNGTSGSQNILIKQGSGGGAAVTILPGETKVVSLDGGGSSAIVTDVFSSLNLAGTTKVDDLTVSDDLIVGDDLTLSSDSAVVTFGADSDTTLTHTDGTGLTLNGTNKLTFGDAASFVHQSSDGVLTVDGEATIDLNASTAVLVSNDLKLNSDSAVVGFGTDNDTTLTHTDGTGLTLNSTNKLTFGDAASFVHQSSDGVLTVAGEATIALAASTAVTVSNDITVAGRATGTQTADNDGNFDLTVSNFWTFTPDGNDTITLTNPAIGQSGVIYLDNSGGHTLSAHASLAINADVLSALTTAGKYMVSYYCTATSGNDTILVSATGALT